MTETCIAPLDAADPAGLYCQYPQQTSPQPVVIALDLSDGEFTAHYDPAVGGGYPERVHHDRTLWWTLRPGLIPTTAAANTLLNDLLPLAQRILDGAEITWDGNNRVGRLTTDAAAAREELADQLQRISDYDYPLVEPVDAGDWYSAGSDGELGITASSTDDDLQRIAFSHRPMIETKSPEGYGVLVGGVEYLTQVRDNQRATLRAQLVDAAAALAAAEQERDRLVRLVAVFDASRVVGRQAGISHTQVQRIVAAAQVKR